MDLSIRYKSHYTEVKDEDQIEFDLEFKNIPQGTKLIEAIRAALDIIDSRTNGE